MNKKRLILTSLVGMVALSALSLSLSLAWYASGDRLSISTLDFVVDAPELKVSTSDELSSFVEELNLNSDEFDEENGDKFAFSPVSSMHQKEWFNEEADKPTLYDCSFIDNTGGNTKFVANTGFYQKKLYLLTEFNYYVGLDPTTSIFEADSAANILRARQFYASKENEELQLSEEEINEALNKLIDCLRVSILINGVTEQEMANRYYVINPTKKDDDKVYLGGRLDNDNDGYYDTYPAFDENGQVVQKEIIYGEVKDRSKIKYDDPEKPNEDDKVLEPSQRFKGNSFKGVSKKSAYTFNEEKSRENGLEFQEEGALTLKELETQTPKIMIPCYANQPREIIISIYLEGWDPDCINATMGAAFNTKLSFKLLRGLI